MDKKTVSIIVVVLIVNSLIFSLYYSRQSPPTHGQEVMFPESFSSQHKQDHLASKVLFLQEETVNLNKKLDESLARVVRNEFDVKLTFKKTLEDQLRDAINRIEELNDEFTNDQSIDETTSEQPTSTIDKPTNSQEVTPTSTLKSTEELQISKSFSMVFSMPSVIVASNIGSSFKYFIETKNYKRICG
jgi:TolA-binding protein